MVDSASGEEERQRIVEITADRQGLSLVRLDKPGLSLARNTALRMSRTAWLAFIDDDAIVASNWLCEARRIIAGAPSSCPVIGGRVDPILPASHRHPSRTSLGGGCSLSSKPTARENI